MKSRASKTLAAILEGKIQQDVAERIGATQQAVSDWVLGNCRPRGVNMVALQKHYGIEPSDWYEPAEEPVEEPASKRARTAVKKRVTAQPARTKPREKARTGTHG